jgi:SAM-dependent methyltransferase
VSSMVLPGSTVLEIGCGTGDLIGHLRPKWGVGIDISEAMIRIARNKYPSIVFCPGDAEAVPISGTFDYVILSDLIGQVFDVWQAVKELRRVARPDTRIIITYFNYLWEPILRLAERLRLKLPQGHQNWLSLEDIENLLRLHGFETVKRGNRLLFPKHVPLLSPLLNRVIAKLPLFRRLCLIGFVVARNRSSRDTRRSELSCSIIVPCKNEVGNIESCVDRIPQMGLHTEIIFVDGNSTDGTQEAILKCMDHYRGKKDIKLISQGTGIGKGDAVRKGFEAASGDLLMILDADLTVPPEDLPKFYLAIAEGRGELINGSRLVYPVERQAMRTLNLIGNKFFSLAFTWILQQRIKDTLCGTKALLKRDYKKITGGRTFFGDFDPFGDFDLLFGAARLTMKITELPIRYRERAYGVTKISRFRHGWLLLRMSLIGLWKLKLS